ncbi:MetQ/NlpA family ABC transporter substrate-binding protein [Periweissella beninensis]|uniref:Metal ABC transporter substrate-binding protein n=1 Tax=Periweissella beninensis TaxID=504936 RepID=A0ABT0VJ37_9LACO|nr:MetQ/NlpA family ABC transporter substrate-binding protein [Periweissella beninensis]MBM7544861.1 D-methionine transport system substrate-binding protein [Periweissella beninensis]MCM2437138.1 metal ABC transporter substrate-binding protein [Periweissella beninensis]MCT4396909.1 metal ABC transporter substrate-binding protein [Periweissella beninensis]
MNYKIIGLSLGIGLLSVGLVACGSQKSSSATKQQNITIGSMGGDAQIWRYIAKSSQAKKAGLKITVKEFTTGPSLNTATANGQVDVNAFQSYAYYEAYNAAKSNTKKLAVLGTTYLEPVGIYSNKYKKLSAIKTGATVAIANNPANAARDLLLLKSAGLIKLKKNFNPGTGTEKDIIANPKKLKITEIDDTTGPRVLKSVDLVLINNTIATEGGLNVLKDSIYHEKISAETKTAINILATAKKEANNKQYLKLVKLYQSAFVKKYVEKEFNGTKVAVNKPISYLTK